ncbi:MAG: hypothetical protein HY675_03435 [Chloroflexi bacterium]|nr:hypothetical protein [Chloroflexota bacterium]
MKQNRKVSGPGNGSSATYQPCPECRQGHTVWGEPCEKCGKCGREFSSSGVIVQLARCEGDLDDWGVLS